MVINEDIYARIKEKKAELDSLRPLSKEQVERLRHQMNIELTYNSNAIEGNTLTLQETKLAIEEGITVGGKPLKYYTEAINHEKALEKIEVIAKGKKRVTLSDIQEIHLMIMKSISDYAGRYRDRRVTVVGAGFTPPNPKKIIPLMVKLEKWMNSPQDNAIEFAALAHYELVRIHPFFDGNGRTSRLLMNLILFRDGYPPTILKKLDRKKYYRVLREADRDNFTPLVNFVARAVEQSLNIYLNAFKKPTSKNELISLAVATKYCDYSQEYLSLLSRRGIIGATKIGRNWFITRNELERYQKKIVRC